VRVAARQIIGVQGQQVRSVLSVGMAQMIFSVAACADTVPPRGAFCSPGTKVSIVNSSRFSRSLFISVLV
jgi:hypothetical protein